MTTTLQQSAYNAQLAAGLPVSELARAVLISNNGRVHHRQCAEYLRAVQQTEWFRAAFAAHTEPLTVVGGRGVSPADAALRQVKMGTADRSDVAKCEHACLHELAHIVTSDRGLGGELREPVQRRGSSKGHHHAWRANFVFIVRQTLGKQATVRLRREFNAWGLPTLSALRP
jgi:hypothetical protein